MPCSSDQVSEMIACDRGFHRWADDLRCPVYVELLDDLSIAPWVEFPPIDVPEDQIWDHSTGGPERRMTKRRLADLEELGQESSIAEAMHNSMRSMHVGINRIRWVAYLVREPKELTAETRKSWFRPNATHMGEIMLYFEQEPSRMLASHGIWADSYRGVLTLVDLEQVVRVPISVELELEGYIIES